MDVKSCDIITRVDAAELSADVDDVFRHLYLLNWNLKTHLSLSGGNATVQYHLNISLLDSFLTWYRKMLQQSHQNVFLWFLNQPDCF